MTAPGGWGMRRGLVLAVNNAPWGMPPAEASTVALVTETGCNKSAARARDISVRTVDEHMRSALNRVRAVDPAIKNRLQMLIAFDRHTRGGDAA